MRIHAHTQSYTCIKTVWTYIYKLTNSELPALSKKIQTRRTKNTTTPDSWKPGSFSGLWFSAILEAILVFVVVALQSRQWRGNVWLRLRDPVSYRAGGGEQTGRRDGSSVWWGVLHLAPVPQQAKLHSHPSQIPKMWLCDLLLFVKIRFSSKQGLFVPKKSLKFRGNVEQELVFNLYLFSFSFFLFFRLWRRRGCVWPQEEFPRVDSERPEPESDGRLGDTLTVGHPPSLHDDTWHQFCCSFLKNQFYIWSSSRTLHICAVD